VCVDDVSSVECVVDEAVVTVVVSGPTTVYKRPNRPIY